MRNKLDQPLPISYCNVGVVAEVGAGVNGLAVIELERGRRQDRGGGQRARKPSTTALASRLRRVHRWGLTRPATQLAIGASSNSLCSSDRLAPRCANLLHPLFGAQHAFD